MKPAFPSPADWQAINPLLDEALDLPATERIDWLERLDGERARHRDVLRALLRTQSAVETHDFLAELPVLDGEPPPSLFSPATGRRIGPYRLIEEIGRGGMGAVWLAERADGLFDRRIALKLPHVVWDDAFAERLERERAILGALEHEHIARLYDAGLDDAGRPYLAMEFVEGRPIDAWCRERALDVPARLHLLLQVMAAVSHAHGRLVVHRDLKPANILVTIDGSVKLLDFGIAKLLAEGASDRTQLTRRAGLALTPDYASPEQIRDEPLGTSSDVYSLGVVAYELLAGARPYQMKRGSAAELEHAIERVDPPLASATAATPALRRALRGDLDAILNRALKKSPAERYASVEAFAQDIERHLNGEPVLARPDRRAYRVAKFVRRHRFAVAMTSALSIAIVAGAGIAIRQTLVAQREEERASDEVSRQRAVRDLYIETLSRLTVLGADHPEQLAGPQAVTRVMREKLEEMAPRMDERSGREAQLEAVMLQLNYNSEFEASLEVGQEYLATLKTDNGSTVRIVDAYSTLGRTLYQLRRLDEAEAMRRAAVEWDAGHDDERTAMSRVEVMGDLASVLVTRGKRAEAQAVLDRADAFAADYFPDHYYRFQNLYQRARLESGFDDAHELAVSRRAHEGIAATHLGDPENQSTDLLFYALALTDNGFANEAEQVYRRQVAVLDDQYGIASRNSVRAVARLVGTIVRQGDPVRARAELAEERRRLATSPQGLQPWAATQLDIRELEIATMSGDAKLAALHPVAFDDAAYSPASIRDTDFGISLQALALSLAGRPSDAVAIMTRLRDRWPDPDTPSQQWVRIMQILATVQLAADRPHDALVTTRRLITMLERDAAMTGRIGAGTYEFLAVAAARDGARDEALRALDEAQRLSASLSYSFAIERADALLRRADAYDALGQPRDAALAAAAALASMPGQAPDSPRLVRARALAAAS